MLCLNPKDRPTIIDILNKPIIKRRVVNYMTEIFTGKYPEASLPNDVDDVGILFITRVYSYRYMLTV